MYTCSDVLLVVIIENAEEVENITFLLDEVNLTPSLLLTRLNNLDNFLFQV